MTSETNEMPTPCADGWPPVLLDPPWRKKKRPPQAEPPEILDLETPAFTEEIVWFNADQVHIEAKVQREQEETARGADFLDRAREFAQGIPTGSHQLYYIVYYMPRDEFLPLWQEMDVERWHPEIMEAPWADDMAMAALSMHGVDAVDGNLALTSCNPKIGVRALAQIRSPRVAPLMTSYLGKRTNYCRLALRWLKTHPEAAAIGLIPQALGESGKLRDAAREGLDILRGLGHQDLLEDVSQRYGDEASEALEILLQRDLLLSCPKKPPKIPKFIENLPEIRTKNGSALPPSTHQDICAMLAFSPVEPPYLGLKQVKETCDPECLGDFAWGLVEAWLGAGGSPSQKWALESLMHFGGGRHAGRLGRRLRGWWREKQKSRALLGIEMLGLMGTDVALQHLAHFARPKLPNKLREAAEAELMQIATVRGLSRKELADRTVPDLGLNKDGRLVLDLGTRQLTVELDTELRPRLQDEEGPVARFPRAKKDDDANAFKAASNQWKELVKELDAVLSMQTARLESAMCERRRWSMSDFQQFLLEHPLLVHLARRLIWGRFNEQNEVMLTFQVCEDLTLADSNGEGLVLPAESRVGIVHPAEASLEGWSGVLQDYAILQPFVQTEREIFRELPSVEGDEVTVGVLLGLKSKGWSLEQESRFFSRCSKKTANGGVTLHFEPGFHRDDFGYLDKAEKQSFKELIVDGGLHPVELSELGRELQALTSS